MSTDRLNTLWHLFNAQEEDFPWAQWALWARKKLRDFKEGEGEYGDSRQALVREAELRTEAQVYAEIAASKAGLSHDDVEKVLHDLSQLDRGDS